MEASNNSNNEDEEDAMSFETAHETPKLQLDCYPYTFTPLLLFTSAGYFDKGYSNYHSVASFFESIIPVNMLDNVLCDRKNMLYEELLQYITDREMLVVCCIDAHFTGFSVLSSGGNSKKNKPALLYYDPVSSTCKLATGESFKYLALYFLLKCNYGDSQHIQDNKDYYTGVSANSTRRTIYSLWKKIHQVSSPQNLPQVRLQPVSLNLTDYLLINEKRNTRNMSTQLTGNTCYFQTFLFAVLVKIGKPVLNRDGRSMDCHNVAQLKETTVNMSRFLLTFFVDSRNHVMRPLTNSNLVVDFYRYRDSPYYDKMTHYLQLQQQQQQQHVPDYEEQYRQVMHYFEETKVLHSYQKFSLDGAMSSTPNTKQLQSVYSTDDADSKLAMHDYYKYRATNLMFGFNAGIVASLESFCEFQALRKNQLLGFYDQLETAVTGVAEALADTSNKYRDYYFMPQFEIGQQQLVDVHHYLYLLDLHAIDDNVNEELVARVHSVNDVLVEHTLFSTQKSTNYDKILPLKDFKKSKQTFRFFKNAFLTIDFFTKFIGLGFAEINPKEKEINALTQTVFYLYDLMRSQAHRQSYEFEKECINQMARSNNHSYMRRLEGGQDAGQSYKVSIPIGFGFTYSKYQTLMHFLSVAENYWNNTDLSNIQVFGKDIRVLLAISSQKIFFDENHCGYYHYGPFEISSYRYREDLDLAVASSTGTLVPSVSSEKRSGINRLIVTDRVFEYSYLRNILEGIFSRANGVRFKPDNEVLNLVLLSFMLDFGLYEQYVGLLNVPFLQSLQHEADTRELQVEVANLIYEFDRKNTSDSVTRGRVEELIFETSYKFLVNKDFDIQSRQFKLIRLLNADPDYQSYVLLCKIYMSLCQINKSVEVDYYKVFADGEFRIIIPQNFSKRTSNYLDEVTRQYTFSEQESIMVYDDLPVFDLRPHQPEINLYKIRFDSATQVQSMVKYIEISNAFHVLGSDERYLVFIADNVLLVDASGDDGVVIRIQHVDVEVATVFFNQAISFIPCLKFADGSEDVVLYTSHNIHYMVDKGGQFHSDYYGMKHELIECIKSHEVFIDANDEHVFKVQKLSELLTESKTVIHFPDYLLTVPDRQQLINLLDLAIQLRNISFFILVLFYLRRASVSLAYIEKESDVIKISGPWKEAILYVLTKGSKNSHYDSIFEKQFFDLNQHKDMPLDGFIGVLCDNFTKYQRWTEDGEYEIVPRPKQKEFLKRIICSETPMHFSEVGSGKTKVIMPLLCQIFLSNNAEAHKFLARSGMPKTVLILVVPEHLVADARTQVMRYCLNLNFRQEYRVYDDIFALLHQNVKLGSMKQIFVTSFNQFKKSLTVDLIAKKVYPHREHILVVADEVDDFLDRNKLVFNICSNKSNAFDRPTLDLFFESSRAAYQGKYCPDALLASSPNPDYWKQLNAKFRAIHAEIQDASKSINKSFGIFNEQTLRHCSTNIAHDVEGYKSLIARPYESVNRAMPGSYYSDVERTIYLTYVILTEDVAKYDELFQSERKFISFEYWSTQFIHQLDFDDLVYGHEKLSEIIAKHPETRDGLSRYLYEIILRKMEIRDKSRSVNSIDVVFNFDCIGFTGTPFLDNYPTFDYIRNERQDDIPDLIDRSFYAYTSEALTKGEFEERFALFQGQNSNVDVEYVSSDFIRDSTDEMTTLESVFILEERRAAEAGKPADFNCIVDLCGIFKRSTVHDVRDLVKKRWPTRFQYLYHIDPVTGADRVLCMNSENDVQFDDEFYRYLCKLYGASLRDRLFFFVDNRNVIGKDIPFQLAYQRQFGQPLITKSIVLAHDVDDFSKIWQAMGRSRTMNETTFAVYKSDIPPAMVENRSGAYDVKKQELTRWLYVHNCDCKMAGNISSIYLTLVALYNLSQRSFYYCDEIVNTFLEKMEKTISESVSDVEEQFALQVLGSIVPAGILRHILADKFRRSSNSVVAEAEVTMAVVEKLLRQIVQQKFELRQPSNDVYDDFVTFLSGEQKSLMEISYTKQQQKQKTKQQQKNQDSDSMGIFDKENQLKLTFQTENYFEYSSTFTEDVTKTALNLPSSVPILTVTYAIGNVTKTINVYPTLQFLYSHHIRGAYMCERVQGVFKSINTDTSDFFNRFWEAIESQANNTAVNESYGEATNGQIEIKVLINFVRQNPQYTIAGLKEGIFLIGMKDQFNSFSVQTHPLCDRIQFVSDDMGFVLYDKTRTKSVDSFSPYCIEQYILLEVLSKQEVAQNVLDYYCNHKETLQRGLDSYDELQGKGFICWRFLINETAKAIAAAKRDSPEDDSQNDHDPSTPKRPRSNDDADSVADGLAKSLDI